MSAEVEKGQRTELIKGKNKILEFLKYVSSEYVIIYAVIVLSAVLTISSDVFLTTGNIMNVLRQTSMIAILAAGIFFVNERIKYYFGKYYGLRLEKNDNSTIAKIVLPIIKEVGNNVQHFGSGR